MVADTKKKTKKTRAKASSRSKSSKSTSTDLYVWSARRKCFCARADPSKEKSKLVPLKGAIPTLRRLFYPSYTHEGANMVTKYSQNGSKAAGSEEDAKHENAYKKRDNKRLRGIKLGLAVGKQLDKTVVWFNKLNCCPRTFFSSEVRATTSKSISVLKTQKTFNSMVKNLHSYTEKVWSTMHKLFLVPMATETVVGSFEMGVGTAVDIECRDTRTGEIVLVELKTNYKERNRCTGKNMQFPFQDLTDSALNQHFLQLLLTYYLYTKTFVNRRVARSYLFRVDEKGVDVDRLPDEFISKYMHSMANRITNTTTAITTATTTTKKQRMKKN